MNKEEIKSEVKRILAGLQSNIAEIVREKQLDKNMKRCVILVLDASIPVDFWDDRATRTKCICITSDKLIEKYATPECQPVVKVNAIDLLNKE